MSSYLVVLRDTTYLAHSMLSSLAFACHFSFIVIAPLLLMGRLELTTYQFSIVFIGYGLAYITGGVAATYLNNRVSPQVQIRAGLLLISAAGITLLIWGRIVGLSVAGVLLPMIVCTTGTTLVRPAATTQALARYSRQAGAAASLNTTLLFAGAGLTGSVVAGFESALPVGLGLLFVVASLCRWWLLACTKDIECNAAETLTRLQKNTRVATTAPGIHYCKRRISPAGRTPPKSAQPGRSPRRTRSTLHRCTCASTARGGWRTSASGTAAPRGSGRRAIRSCRGCLG